ncbi:signal transduction histidine kinase [Novosphingobium sp. Rr 2-17]|nr:signal transduction histidine kinase [Novosphingobium sp. Rr 2-17]
MMAGMRRLAGRVWPVLRLRSLLLTTLLLVAALPGFAALFLRVYENTLVRRTEAEVIAQGAAIAASAAVLWPGTSEPPPSPPGPEPDPRQSVTYEDTLPALDLRTAPILPERPPARAVQAQADKSALVASGAMMPVIAQTQRYTLASILLLDRQGLVLTGRDQGMSLAHVPEVRTALSGAGVTVLRHNDSYGLRYPLEWISRATDLRLHRAQPIVVNRRVVGVVLVSRSSAALFRGMWEDRGKIALGVAVIFGLLVAMTAVLVRAIVRPVEALSMAARALARGAPAEPPRPTLEVVEIRSLVEDFAAMAAAIERRSRYLRDFAAALSHEFKTPLAGLAGGIELLQDHGETMTAQEHARFLANMEGDARRLSRLVTRLMELAQADMRGPDPDAVSDLATVCARLADAAGDRDFSVVTELSPNLPPLAIDSSALETVLGTLIENARQAGAARVDVTAQVLRGDVLIDLVDDGPGISPRDRQRIFDPFFTSRRADGGTGLGLPIARALLAAASGSLDLLPSDHGAWFRLTVKTG